MVCKHRILRRNVAACPMPAELFFRVFGLRDEYRILTVFRGV